ncbi:hypothetical protein HHL19_16165 [Streptomyces sp. R302]|uniref:hypothetical protein n=1 Tax=unclassified Streptomyces TaxID=2593676 RepID=UPI00145F4D03|nr:MULTISPECIES: hypothetical protein [unclassified Streptomyces]NML55308.1 hypothetical protein [Streptomyces sp. R301]NML80180.1 hypothetical protein [Streptomyces sp. R302]
MSRPEARGAGRRRPTSAEHVLGQIARGEVRVGPKAAREIAAQHQAAYGDAVWGPAPGQPSADAECGPDQSTASR